MMENEVHRANLTSIDDPISDQFTFANPSFVVSLEKMTSFGVGSEHVFSAPSPENYSFTFAAPFDAQNRHLELMDCSTKNENSQRYKPKISRNTYKPTINVFTQALKGTPAFEQLKKHSRSRVKKRDLDNSITCTDVPKSLLTKAAAMEYFSGYGPPLKITVRPRKQTVTIYYETREAADAAYNGCGEFLGETFNVQRTSSEMLPKAAATKRRESDRSMVRNLITATDDEIDAELEALRGLEYNLHEELSTIPESLKSTARKARPSEESAKHSEKITSKADKPSAKVDKFETESQIQKFVPSATVEELQSVIRQAAHTSEDRYKVLEARDRLMRLKQVKQHSLATATAHRGTCPDMCPEKERLMRESQRQVATYEQLDGSEYRINHATAVKQYSRSSADQEEPLPHDLRPVASLKMTMSYLLHEIADLCEAEGTNLAEWFHFLWDRTRGIRKDVTQQELCCVDSVELVEQCARFHIVCSERLCAEEPSVFDKKINTENLTKCLQTLKYMYHDLRVKGIACRNEPEFRAYVVLLNLNNGNFMWDIQKLPTEIQKSAEVKFAVQVYSALESNNFSKFFKLVQGTGYLNACILLRYFNQVRVKALEVMVKAYCRTTSTAFPLYELIDILAFEDENEVMYFCEQVGLNVSNDEMYVMLNRKNFTLPDANIDQGRAINVVDSKRTKTKSTFGRCIAGSTQPERSYRNHKPHSSFDSQGYLTPASLTAEDQRAEGDLRRSDPYEFTERDGTFARPQKLGSQLFKKPIDRETNDSSSKIVAEPPRRRALPTRNAIAKSGQEQFRSSADSTQTSRAETNVSAEPRRKIVEESPAKLDEPYSSEANGEARKTIFSSSAEQKISNENTAQFGIRRFGVPNFGAAPESSSIFSKPNAIFSRAAAKGPTTEGSSSLFAMAANKSIFAGAPKGNIFAKSGATTGTVFASYHQTTPESTAKRESQPPPSPTAKIRTSRVKESQDALMAKIEAEKKQRQLENYEKKLSAEKRKFDRLLAADKEAKRVFEQLEHEVTAEMCAAAARDEMFGLLGERMSEKVLSQFVEETCRSLLGEEIRVAVRLDELSRKARDRMIRRRYKIWRQYASRKRRQREALDDTPVWLQRQSVEECAKLLYHPEQDLVVRNMCRKRAEAEQELIDENRVSIEFVVYAGVRENLRSLDVDTFSNAFWKLVISWPDLANRLALWRHKKAMNEYLSPENYTTEPIIKTYKPNSYETLNVCIRHFEGLINDRNLIGMDALLLVTAASEEPRAVIKRLRKTILSRRKLMPIPVVIAVLEDGVPELEGVRVALEELLESGYVSEYTLVLEKSVHEKAAVRLAQSAALWLSMNKSPPVPLEMDYLKAALGASLTEELWLRIQGQLAFNAHLSAAIDDPSFVINLHNEAVTHLVEIFLDQESLLYTDFPPEFRRLLPERRENFPRGYEYFDDSWKLEEQRSSVERIMNDFFLPKWRFEWPIKDSWELNDAVTGYCREALPGSNCGALSNMLFATGDSRTPSFINVLLEIVKEKISALGDDLRVVYNRNHIKHFRTLPWWFKSSTLTEYASCDAAEPCRKRRRESANDSDGPDCEEVDPLEEFCRETRQRIADVSSNSFKFERDFEEQRLRSEMMEKMLEEALMGDAKSLYA